MNLRNHLSSDHFVARLKTYVFSIYIIIENHEQIQGTRIIFRNIIKYCDDVNRRNMKAREKE